MCDRGAITPKTAVDFFPFCGAITFFSTSPIKRAALEKLEIMQSYTYKADKLYLEAENVQIPDYIPPFTSCYETLYQQEELIERTRTMEDSARQIRHQFQTIADSGFPLTTSTLLRKQWSRSKKESLCSPQNNFRAWCKSLWKTNPTCCFDQKAIQRTTLFSFSGLLISMTRFAVFKKMQR